MDSSNKYNSLRDGRARNNKMILGMIVQIVSIFCLSVISIDENLFIINKVVIYITNVRIIIKINIEWSWKKISCSISGEFASWNPNCPHWVI